MAAPDRHEMKVQCKGCGAITIVGVSENDYPGMRRLDREIEYVKPEILQFSA